MSWRERPIMPFARAGAAVAVVSGWVVVMGGRRADGRATRTVQAYNAAESRWVVLNDLPDAREGAAAVSVGRRIILTGGRNDTGGTVDKVAELRPSTTLGVEAALKGALWTYTTPMSRDRYRHTATLFDGRLWVVGGLDAANTVRRTVESMHLTTYEWRDEPSIPEPRFGHAAAVNVGATTSALYVFGGRNASVDHAIVYRITPGGAWAATVHLMPTGASLHTAVVHDDEIVIAGNRTPSVMVIRFDPTAASAAWSVDTALPAARSDMASAVVGSKMLHFGGDSTTGVAAEVWEGPSLPPLAPVPLFPVNASVSGNEPVKFRWRNVWQNTGDSQSSYVLTLTNADTTWTVSGFGPNPSHTFPPDTFTEGLVWWSVVVTNTAGVSSPGSPLAKALVTAAPPDFAIVEPTDGQVITAPVTTAVIGSFGHEAFEMRRVSVGADGEPDITTVYWTSAPQYGAERTQLQVAWPTNNRTEFLQARIFRYGVWSPWVSRQVSIAYTGPATPLVDVYEDDDRGALVVRITNPEGEPVVTRNELWRTEYTLDEYGAIIPTAGTEVRLVDALNLPPNGVHIDYRTASGVAYAYAAGAYGDNGAYTRGAWVGVAEGVPLPDTLTVIYDGGHISVWDPTDPILGD